MSQRVSVNSPTRPEGDQTRVEEKSRYPKGRRSDGSAWGFWIDPIRRSPAMASLEYVCRTPSALYRANFSGKFPPELDFFWCGE